MRQGKVLGLLGTRGAGKDSAAKALLDFGWKRIAFGDAIYVEVAEAFGVSVEFLQNRGTKETPLPQLALRHCKDVAFVRVMQGIAVPDSLPMHPLLRAVLWLIMPLTMYEERQAVRAMLHQPRSPREILQFWGTEYRRRLCGDDYWLRQVTTVLDADPAGNYVVTDVRDPNEAVLITERYQGQLIRIVRPVLETAAAVANDATLQHPTETVMRTYPVHHTIINQEGLEGLAGTLDGLRRVVLAPEVRLAR